MTSQPTIHRAQQLLGKATATARRKLRDVVTSAHESATSTSATRTRPTLAPVLPPSQALRENGFTVFRGLFSTDECAALAADLKNEAGISDSVKYMKVDAANSFLTARHILLEGRILDAVRSSIGVEARFLQVSDLHYLHDTTGWHRDSVHRAPDASQAPDWSDTENPFGVVKAILYLEADNAAMGVMAGSHASPIAMDANHVNDVEAQGGQIVVGPDLSPNRRLTEEEKRTPLAWKAEVGDVLVFDERMYHAGRRVEDGHVSSNRAAPKFTLSLVFGADNHHSERMYSYFRFARKELHYRDLPEEFTAELASRGLVLSQGWTNFYRQEPQELRHVHLPDPTQLTPLIEEFSER